MAVELHEDRIARLGEHGATIAHWISSASIAGGGGSRRDAVRACADGNLGDAPAIAQARHKTRHQADIRVVASGVLP